MKPPNQPGKPAKQKSSPDDLFEREPGNVHKFSARRRAERKMRHNVSDTALWKSDV
jgi:hypothetical protein